MHNLRFCCAKIAKKGEIVLLRRLTMGTLFYLNFEKKFLRKLPTQATLGALLKKMFIIYFRNSSPFQTAALFLGRVRVLTRLIGNAVKISGYARSCKFHSQHFQLMSLPFWWEGAENGNKPEDLPELTKPKHSQLSGTRATIADPLREMTPKSLFLTFLIQTNGRFVHY